MFSTKGRRGLAAAVGVGLVLAATACGSDESSSHAESAAGDTVDVTGAPEQVTWQSFQSIKLPVSAVSGPSTTVPVASGYELSPQGAGLAAINTSVRIATAPDGQWAAQVKASLAPGAGRDDFMINRAQLSIQPGQVQADALPTVRGYIVRSYDEPAATVEVITSYPDDSVLATTTQLLWRDGDWKVVLPDPIDAIETQRALQAVPANLTALEAS